MFYTLHAQFADNEKEFAMKRYIALSLFVALGAMLWATGCSSLNPPDPLVDNDTFQLFDDEEYFYITEVEPDGTEFDLEESTTALGGEFQILDAGSDYKFVKVAKINAPKHEGEKLQATDVALAGDETTTIAYVSYVMAGLLRHGGIDVIEMKDGVYPKIVSRLYTKKDDVNSVAYDESGNRIDMGLNVDPDEYGIDKGAYFRTAELDSSYKFKTSGGNIISAEFDLESYAANDAVVLGSNVLLPVGSAGGGVDVIGVTSGGESSPPSLARTIFINAPSDTDDTRAIALTPDVSGIDFITYCGPDGNSPQILKYNSSFSEVSSPISISGPSYIETKSALRVYDNVALIAASDGGVIAVNIETDATLFTIPNATRGGLTPDLVTANDVVIGTPKQSSNSLLFIANGEYGVRVYKLGFKLEDSTDVASDLTGFNYSSAYQGYISTGSNNSTNSLMFRNGYLYIGTGLGGVRIISIMDKSVSQTFKKPNFK
jgi:hypothetical protein